MPITYSFDQERNLVLTKVTGELSTAVTEDYFERLLQDKDCPSEAIEIVDFSGVTDFTIHYADMRKIVMIYQMTKSTRNIWATIFSCKSDLSYGIARMLEALHEIANKDHKVIVTRSQEELDKHIEALRSNRLDIGDSE